MIKTSSKILQRWLPLMNLERGIIPHPKIEEVLICLCAEYSATYNFEIAMMYND